MASYMAGKERLHKLEMRTLVEIRLRIGVRSR